MRNTISLIAALLPAPVMAAEFRCIPDRICVPGSCLDDMTDESVLRFTHPDSAAPALHSYGEVIAMTKTVERSGVSQWEGVNAKGEYEILHLIRNGMGFTHTIGGEFVKYVGREIRYMAKGTCEVQ